MECALQSVHKTHMPTFKTRKMNVLRKQHVILWNNMFMRSNALLTAFKQQVLLIGTSIKVHVLRNVLITFSVLGGQENA